jgi:pimeloyl-ACP methyl ester carboxylesterase
MNDNSQSFSEIGEGSAVICLLDEKASALLDILSGDFAIFSRAHSSLDGETAIARAEALYASAQKRGISTFALVAENEGCATALAAAALYPDAVEAIVMMAPQVLDEHGAPRDLSLAGHLQKIETQILALFGTRSAIASPATGGRYKRALAKCHLVYVYDADEVATDRLEAASEVIIDFLQRRDAFLVNNKDGRILA